MRILYKPRVALKTYLPNAEREIEEAARVCWQSWERSNGTIDDARAFIGRLQKVGHIDTLEESFFSVWIECSRAASHQIVRHRTFHFLQASQRYIKLDEPEFLMPPRVAEALHDDGVSPKEHYLEAMEDAWYKYRTLREKGMRPEDARYVLPNAALTKLKASANFANWRKFFELRCDQTAQWEIRMIANTALKIALQIAPQVFGDLADRFLIQGAIYAEEVDREEFDNRENWVEDNTSWMC